MTREKFSFPLMDNPLKSLRNTASYNSLASPHFL